MTVNKRGEGLALLVTCLIIRIFAAVITTITELNPDSTADAVVFGQRAEMIARGTFKGHPYMFTPGQATVFELLIPFGDGSIFQLWGTLLAPFWLLPGPSGFYARFANAIFGAFAVYNVYLITRHFHSHHAGIIAALPMMFYPSFVAVQSTLLREAVILFGITSTVRLITIPSRQRSQLFIHLLAGCFLYIALLLRTDNVIIYAVAAGSALIMQAVESRYLPRRSTVLGLVLSPILFILSLSHIRERVEYLARIRELRTTGRATYLSDIIPRTILELVAFSWIGAAYFLYAPFPWMITTIPDLLISLEGVANMFFTVLAIWGVRSLGQKNGAVTVGLLFGFGVAVTLYGVGTGNYGTGMRHRQMFLWVLFLFAGIGFTEQIRVKKIN